MDEVADRNHLQERNGVWYYRRRVPWDLVRSFGSQFVKKSLKTGLIKEAQQRRNILDVQFDAEFADLRKSAGPSSVTRPAAKIVKAGARSPLSREQVQARVSDYISEQVSKFETNLQANPVETTDQKIEILSEREMIVDVLGTPEHGLQHEWVADAFQQLFGDARFAEVTSVHAAELVRRGLLEIARREIAVLSDEFTPGGFDGLFLRSGRTSVTFGQVAEEYLSDEIERARINRRKEQWSIKSEPTSRS
jgi:hypothetical protein